MTDPTNSPDFIRPGMTGDAAPDQREVTLNRESDSEAFIPETPAQEQLKDRQTPRSEAKAHTDDAPDTRRQPDGAYTEQQQPRPDVNKQA